MATKSYYQGGVASTGGQLNFTDDALSPVKGTSLWQTCPLLAIAQDPSIAVQFYDHFTGLTKAADAWIATQATSGTATAGVLAGGTVALSAGATTNHQGEQIQLAGGFVIPAANKHVWFETRLKVNVLTAELFFGLANIDTTIIATGALSTSDNIGIKSVTADGVLLPTVASASTETAGTTIGTLATATYVRLGFVLTSNTSVQFYVNGVATGAAITTNIPSVVLTPSFVCQATGTGTPVLDVDYVRCVQLI